jgi:septal ring factor EnvC (AmiA/AmiB activator)
MARFSDRTGLLAMVAGSVAFLLLAPIAALGQSDRASNAEKLKQRDQELETIRAEQKKASENEKKLRTEIEALGEDRRKLNQALLDTADKVRSVETALNATEARLAPLQDQEQTLRRSLEARRNVIAEVLATLQRMGRHAPPAVIAQPEDALESVRAAIVLGSVLPELRDKAKSLSDDLTKLVALREGIAREKAKLTNDLASLANERQRMNLLVEERQKKQAEAEKSLDVERQRTAMLGRQAESVRDLIARLEQGLDPATRAARSASHGLVDPKGDLRAALKDPGRLTPAVAFASAKGLLPMPVSGTKARSFGESDGLGGLERGVSITTRDGAQVTSPCDAWVVYAGPFRSYGQLLILNAGGGYHVVLAGMERISVDLGQFVLTGEPVAVMGSGSHIAAMVPTGASQPVLYVEFRKDGVPVDSSPWWATSEGEKVRG